ALEICTDVKDRKGRADALWGLADVHRRRREYEEAIWLYSDVWEICTDLNDRKGKADALWGLADVHRRRSEYEEAIPLYSEVLKICTALKDRKGRADALWGLADVYRRRHELAKALPLVFELWEISNDLDNKAEALPSLARARPQEEHGEVIPIPFQALKGAASEDEWLLGVSKLLLEWFGWDLLMGGLPTEAGSETSVSVQQVHVNETPSKSEFRT
ncbi:hypothetical protein FRC00_005282, partial [Tulasnella sp. 408]